MTGEYSNFILLPAMPGLETAGDVPQSSSYRNAVFNVNFILNLKQISAVMTFTA